MTDPIIKEEGNYPKKTAPRQIGERSFARPENFKLNPKSFDWFLDGIDKTKLDALQAKIDETIIRVAEENKNDEQVINYDLI